MCNGRRGRWLGLVVVVVIDDFRWFGFIVVVVVVDDGWSVGLVVVLDDGRGLEVVVVAVVLDDGRGRGVACVVELGIQMMVVGVVVRWEIFSKGVERIGSGRIVIAVDLVEEVVLAVEFGFVKLPSSRRFRDKAPLLVDPDVSNRIIGFSVEVVDHERARRSVQVFAKEDAAAYP